MNYTKQHEFIVSKNIINVLYFYVSFHIGAKLLIAEEFCIVKSIKITGPQYHGCLMYFFRTEVVFKFLVQQEFVLFSRVHLEIKVYYLNLYYLIKRSF